MAFEVENAPSKVECAPVAWVEGECVPDGEQGGRRRPQQKAAASNLQVDVDVTLVTVLDRRSVEISQCVCELVGLDVRCRAREVVLWLRRMGFCDGVYI